MADSRTRVRYTIEDDLKLLQIVHILNPFGEGHKWTNVQQEFTKATNKATSISVRSVRERVRLLLQLYENGKTMSVVSKHSNSNAPEGKEYLQRHHLLKVVSDLKQNFVKSVDVNKDTNDIAIGDFELGIYSPDTSTENVDESLETNLEQLIPIEQLIENTKPVIIEEPMAIEEVNIVQDETMAIAIEKLKTIQKPINTEKHLIIKKLGVQNQQNIYMLNPQNVHATSSNNIPENTNILHKSPRKNRVDNLSTETPRIKRLKTYTENLESLKTLQQREFELKSMNIDLQEKRLKFEMKKLEFEKQAFKFKSQHKLEELEECLKPTSEDIPPMNFSDQKVGATKNVQDYDDLIEIKMEPVDFNEDLLQLDMEGKETENVKLSAELIKENIEKWESLKQFVSQHHSKQDKIKNVINMFDNQIMAHFKELLNDKMPSCNN